MTFRINSHVSALVRIDGVELPLSNGNALHKLHIVAGSRLTLPALHMEFTDTVNALGKQGLQDGALIEVTLDGGVAITRRFRVAKWTRPPAQAGFSYAVDAYWDSPKYWAGTANRALSGTSTVALRELAAECGLGFFSANTATSDAQRWLPRNQTWGNFASNIAQHGYAQDRSCMVLGVDSTGLMRYLDVNGTGEPKIILTSTPKGSAYVLVSDFVPTSQSGMNNLLAGYRYTRVLQSALAATSVEDTIAVASGTDRPLLNLDVRAKQGTGRVIYSPIDCGNTHPRFERARYQNTRYNRLFSAGGEFVTAQQTTLEFGDIFTYVSPAAFASKSYDGKFTIATKVIYIVGSLYQEKLVAYKHGVES